MCMHWKGEVGKKLLLFRGSEDLQRGKSFLEVRIKDAMRSGIQPLATIAETLAGLKTGLLNDFQHSSTSAVTEGSNNKIKTLNRPAYGFRDMVY